MARFAAYAFAAHLDYRRIVYLTGAIFAAMC